MNNKHSQQNGKFSVAPPITGRLLLEVTQRLRRSQSLSLLHEMEPAPYVSRDEVLKNQFRLLSQLLTHAEARVPYYREMFSSLGIKSSEIRTLSDFSQLPVLTKDIIRERERDLIAEGLTKEKLVQGASGGSTGIPLRFYYDSKYLDASEAGTFRNLRQSGWQPGEMVAFFWGFNEDTRQIRPWEFELRQHLRRMYQFNPFKSGPLDMDEWIRRWRTLGARVIYGYASTVARFAAHIEERGERVAQLRGAFTTGEKLYPQQREVIARVFGCNVFDCYGSSEVRNIATECLRGRMHINADFVILETDSAFTQMDAPQPFIVTSLLNHAMPFIRYRNEDCGAIRDERCDCGNNFPLMHLDVGRVNDNFVLSDGKVVHGLFFTYLMYGSEGVANFQFHQTALDSITLWFVPGYGSADRVIKAAVEQIKALTAAPMNVEVREVQQIPLSATGKHRYTRSDVSAVMTEES